MRIPPQLAIAFAIALVCLGHAGSAGAQVFELIDSFAGCPPEGCDDSSDIARPVNPLLLGPDGHFYGSTGIDWRDGEAAPRSWGTIFRIDTAGQRTILKRFSGEAGGCGSNRSITIGDDGAVYGVGSRCIFRLIGASFEVLQTFPVGGFIPDSIFAGPGGAFYGFGVTGTGTRVIYKWSGDVTLLLGLPLQALVSDMMRGPDGNLYFSLEFLLGYGTSAGVYRLTTGDRIESVRQFGKSILDLIIGVDGRLCASTRDASSGMLFSVLFCMTASGAEIPMSGGEGTRPLAVGTDGSLLVVWGTTILWLSQAGMLVPVHAFDGTDGSGGMSRMTHGADGHLYGVGSGGAHGEGVFYRIRMPRVDVRANGSDAPAAVTPGTPLAVSLAFDAAPTTTVNPSEVYVAVVTPSLDVFWMTAAGGFTTAPTRLYAGPVAAFAPVPLLTIPDAVVLPEGDYYWVAIVDADTNGVPNGAFVDVVKVTRGG